MLKQALNLIRPYRSFSSLVLLFFYGFIFFVIADAKLPPLEEQAFVLRKYLFEDKKQYFPDPNGVFSLFAPYAPPRGDVSFIMDFPFSPYGISIAQLYSAQNYFAPLILNPYPQEKRAFVYCSANRIATARLQETGYKLRVVLADGKGLAEKNL